MPQSNSKIMLIIYLCTIITAFFSGVLLSKHKNTNKDVQYIEGLLWPNPPTIEPFQLKDHHGKDFTLNNLRDRWSLVFFGFANCPDICPTALQAMTKAVKKIKEKKKSPLLIQTIFISVDPERDTLPNLAKYASYFSANLIAATGSPDQLKAMAKSFNTIFMKINEIGEDYSIEHSSGVFFVSPTGHMASVLTPPHNTLKIVERFENIFTFYNELSDE